MQRKDLSRRDTLKHSAAVAGTALAGALVPNVHATGSDTIKVALVGCGGRGSGAAINALSTQGPTQLYAIADVFPDRTEGVLKRMKEKFPRQIEVNDRCFLGFDAYKKAIDSIAPGGVVILATPPAFRPLHVEYAVAKGVNVFMEKSFGVDAPGARRILLAGEVAKKKNVKVAGGLMSRHSKPLEQTIEQIHNGIIGDVITCWAYREHGPVGYRKRDPKVNELGHQIRNYSCFNWTNGTFFLDWLIHNIDICCWVKNQWPVSCQGQGGRQTRVEADQLFDQYMAEYSFADGTRLLAQGRHINNCWNFFGDVIFGTKGCAVLGEGISSPRIYKGFKPLAENIIWKPEKDDSNAYQYEHDLLFDAIRNDKPCNEAERCVKTCVAAILGRMACESGKLLTWDQAWDSKFEFAPNLDQMTWDTPAPVQPDANGNYPVAKPGVTMNF